MKTLAKNLPAVTLLICSTLLLFNGMYWETAALVFIGGLTHAKI